jgi:predicted transcriptional regulator
MDKFFVKGLESHLLDLLPRGSIQKIADETGIDRNSIRRILRGEWTNEAVIRRALEILEQYKQQIDEILEMAAAA